MAEAAGHATGDVAESRRDFLKILTVATGAVGLSALAWPFIDALGPDANSEAQANLIVNVASIADNTAIQTTWAGLPIYIRKLTDQQLVEAQAVVTDTLPDPANFMDRVKAGYEHFVIVVGLNTGVPCVLQGNLPTDPRGNFGGWLCPCDGSQYDVLGRVRSGPAKKNLVIPRFRFLNDAQIQFG